MLMAQASMSPLKARSANEEFPRERRNRRMSETGALVCAMAPVETTPAVDAATSGAFSEVVCGVLMRISDKGKVTVFRLKWVCEQNVNGQRNQRLADDNPMISS
jgi:hypothetical protein